MPVRVHYACSRCGAGARIEEGHVRVTHWADCKRWEYIRARFPGLARMKEEGKVSA